MDDLQKISQIPTMEANIASNMAIVDAMVATIAMQVPQLVPMLLQQLEAQQFLRGTNMQPPIAKANFETRMDGTKQLLQQLRDAGSKT